MKLFYALLLYISIQTTAESNTHALNTLSELEWKHRVIIIAYSKTADIDSDILDKYQSAIKERHIIWFTLKQDSVQTNYYGHLSPSLKTQLLKQYGSNRNSVTLIGKDGGVKYQSKQLNIDAIFALIDTMPMRIQEMNSH